MDIFLFWMFLFLNEPQFELNFKILQIKTEKNDHKFET